MAKRKAKKEKPVPAAMIIRPAPEKPWEVNQEQVTILKNTICKGATDTELQFCLTVSRRYKLDPFRGQIWFVKRADRSVEGGYRWIPIVGINGLLHIASRDHKDFGSFDEPEYGPMREIQWKYYDKSGTIKAPDWARVKAWKKGHDHPVVATVWWDEIYPEVGAAPLVRQMPRLMLGKCARAQVTRQAYPATDGLYIKEEFQGREEFTEGGRQIVYPDSDVPVTGSREAAQAVAAAKIAAHTASLAAGKQEGKADPTNAPVGQQPEAAKETQGSGDQRDRSRDKTASDDGKPSAPKGDIEIDWSNEASPIVLGDLADLTEMIEKHCNAKWDGSWWRIPPAKAEVLREMCRQLNFRLTETMPKVEPKSSPGKGSPSLSPGAAAGGKGQAPKTAPSAAQEPELVIGIIEQANPQEGKAPRVSVLLKIETEKGKFASHWMTSFDKPHFEPLLKGKGKSAEFYVTRREKDDKTYTNIVGLKRVGNIEFDEDGKTPVVQNKDREAGGRTLFP